MYVCVCVSLDRQNPHLVFKTLRNQYTWASYDTLEKTIILSFAEKALVKRKGLQTLRLSHRAVSACGLMRRTIRGKPYMCICVLRNATRSCFTRAQERRIESQVKFDQPSEVTFKDVSGKLN